MPSDHNVVLCDGCRARIRWAITVNGRRQAVNADPDPKGNLACRTDHTGTLKVRVLTAERDRLEGDEWQAMPHIATCTSPRPRPWPSSRPGRRAAVRPGSWRWPR
ncbi:hypothetical protein CFC35_23025 [Streptomyces sp. FBKL.4005]|uniref:hypothetical protein n=1 Tax=Streptomyces sp. FBKL.4005 TaxID=2015515 RepID=UPI000B969C70|nr:hypothetical protein [Streptomyces sp. FBKL.4005]OYP17024.1 hypothetical protein CFC35_23025 [Streptomyces sp. FBKL.4005]